MHLVKGSKQRERLQADEWDALDRALDRIRFDEAMDRTAQRVARWKRKKAWKTPLLLVVGGLGWTITWFARRGK